MIYIVLDNYDQGLELREVEDFDALAEELREHQALEGHFNRIQQLIFGEEIPFEVVKQYYHL